jgi:transposase
MKAKVGDLTLALDGHFGSHHAVVARQILDHIDFLDASIERLTEEVMERIVPFRELIELLDTIPGIDQRSAEVIIAETGGDMSRWPTSGHFAAWAGVAPASHESAGKRKPAGTRHGGRWLRTTLIESARAASRTKDTYLSAQYRRVASRRGPNKACVAVANSIAVAIWHVSTKRVPYEDLGGDYFEKRKNPERETRRLVAKLEAMGHKVSLDDAA